MAKPKTAFVCNDCGADYRKWQGQCNACGAWNTITEVRLGSDAGGARSNRFEGYAGGAGKQKKVVSLSEVALEEMPRFSSGSSELDRVLGGGLVPGSAVLIGATPVRARVPCCCRPCAIWWRRCPRCTSPVRSRCNRWRCARHDSG